MFYVNDEPKGKFLYTETIKLYCTGNDNEDNIIPYFQHVMKKRRKEANADCCTIRQPIYTNSSVNYKHIIKVLQVRFGPS